MCIIEKILNFIKTTAAVVLKILTDDFLDKDLYCKTLVLYYIQQRLLVVWEKCNFSPWETPLMLININYLLVFHNEKVTLEWLLLR